MTLNTRPESIAIIGKGDSELEYRLGLKPKVDEVWGVNDIGIVYPDLDKLWVMDDLLHHPKCQFTVDHLKTCKSPIITSKAYKEFPTSIEFPLEDAKKYLSDNDITQNLFASTIAYMLLYAEMIGVKSINLYGVDFTEDNPELTLATAFMLGRLSHKGVIINLPTKSRLLNLNSKKYYGYRGDNNG